MIKEKSARLMVVEPKWQRGGGWEQVGGREGGGNRTMGAGGGKMRKTLSTRGGKGGEKD